MDLFPLLMLPPLFVAVLLGIPVSFSLLGVALFFGYSLFGPAVIHQFVGRLNSVASSFELAALPLFIFMGSMLERSGIAERLFTAIHLWTKRIPGGLALGTIVMAVIFAASSGVIGATETIIGLLAAPAMLKFGYNRAFTSGVICSSGSLATVIPPSIAVVVLAPLANASIGDLFMSSLIPGLLLAFLYMAYSIIYCFLFPPLSPVNREEEETNLFWPKIKRTIMAVLPPFILIICVLGSMMFGIAAPTEAAALGALGSFVLAIYYNALSWNIFHQALMRTVTVTSMIMFLVFGGSVFTGIFITAGGARLIEDIIQALSLTPFLVLLSVLFLAFLAGFFLDWISVLLLFIPIFIPIMVKAGFDKIWLCTLFLLVVQTSYLTPPLAPAIFYFRGVAPPEITVQDVIRGVIPFILLQLVVMILILMYPAIATWLPAQISGF